LVGDDDGDTRKRASRLVEHVPLHGGILTLGGGVDGCQREEPGEHDDCESTHDFSSIPKGTDLPTARRRSVVTASREASAVGRVSVHGEGSPMAAGLLL